MQPAFENFILDIDGVLYGGATPIPNAARTVSLLQKKGKGVFFLTNNSTKTRGQYAKRLSAMSILADKGNIYTSSQGTAAYLLSKGIKRVFPIGEEGLRIELKKAGLAISSPNSCEAVAVGLDRKITYEKIALAADAIREGALFVATNLDATFPIEGGLAPGAGAIVKAISVAAQKEPSISIGKPNAFLLEQIIREHKISKKTLSIVGDRLDTDIQMANKAGVYSFCVLTGVATKKEAACARGSYKPKKIVNSISDILQFI